MKELYIKKFWNEENILFYLHSQDDIIVRQIEIQGVRKVCLDEKTPSQDGYSLADVTLSALEIESPVYITEEEFNAVWKNETNVVFIPEGDIFKLAYVTSYAHGCNCAGAMGKGIALQFKERFPQMYEEYKLLCKKNQFVLGDVLIYPKAKGFVYNLATQQDWRTMADLKAIKQALVKMLEHASVADVRMIALPRIGAGLGGLDWECVRLAIQQVSSQYPNVRLFVVESYQHSLL